MVLFVYFCFYVPYSGDESKKVLLLFMLKSVLPMFSSKSFIASGLIFSSLIHFEFIFVYRVKECSSFIFLYVAVQFSQHHLLKRLCFLHCLVCHRLIDHRCADLFLGFLFCSINLYFYFCASTILFGTSFYVCQRLVPNNPRTQE